jgi:hypothetical protein
MIDFDGLDLVLDQRQIGLGLQDGEHARGIGGFVALGAVGADGGAFAAVEDAELDAGAIGVEGHFAAEGIEFEDHVGFGDAADGGIAGHARHGQGSIVTSAVRTPRRAAARAASQPACPAPITMTSKDSWGGGGGGKAGNGILGRVEYWNAGMWNIL